MVLMIGRCRCLSLCRAGVQPLHRAAGNPRSEEHHGQGHGSATAEEGQHGRKSTFRNMAAKGARN